MNAKKLIAINVGVIALLVGGGVGGFYAYEQSANYIKTDYAKISGVKTTIVSPSAGELTKWDVRVGDAFTKGEKLGEVSVPSPTEENPKHVKKIDVTAPKDGTVVSSTVEKDSVVGQGTPLAYTYNLDELTVTANIKETKISEVEIGQEVDVTIDAFDGEVFEGEITEIGRAAASEFSLLATGNANANYTKVTQVIPVTISIKNTKGNDLLPGMNASVKIHK